MCGRFSEHIENLRQWEDILAGWPRLQATRRNVAPTQSIHLLRAGHKGGHKGGHEGEPGGEPGWAQARWGLVPPWSREAAPRYATFNARLEEVAGKPSYRGAWRGAQHALIPAGGYYEWRLEQGAKQPYFLHAAQGGPLVFAGLWEERVDTGSGEIVLSATILTRAARPPQDALHHREPVLLEPAMARQWLRGGAHAQAALPEAPTPALQWYRVSPRVNNARNEGAELTAPI